MEYSVTEMEYSERLSSKVFSDSEGGNSIRCSHVDCSSPPLVVQLDKTVFHCTGQYNKTQAPCNRHFEVKEIESAK